MTRSQVRKFIDLMQKLKRHVPFPLDLGDHEAFFRDLADKKLQQ